MKIAEALLARAEHQKVLAQLRERIVDNASHRIDAGAPMENPNELLAEYLRVSTELAKLVGRISRTNAVERFDDLFTLAEALAERQRLAQHHKILTELADAGSLNPRGARSWGRYSGEVRYVSAVDIANLRSRADDLAGELRTLNVQLQRRNWEVDLIEWGVAT